MKRVPYNNRLLFYFPKVLCYYVLVQTAVLVDVPMLNWFSKVKEFRSCRVSKVLHFVNTSFSFSITLLTTFRSELTSAVYFNRSN